VCALAHEEPDMKKENDSIRATVDARARFHAIIASGALKACERHVAGAYDAEDRIAEGVAMTWKWYQQQVALGRDPELALVRHCCKCRTVDRSHRLDSGDRSHWPQDIYNMQGRRGVELRRLQIVDDVDDRVEEDANLGLAEPGCADPTEKLDSAIDLEDWLGELSAHERTLLAMRQAGYGLVETGTKLKSTASTVWKHTQELGRELAERAGVTIEKKERRSRLPRGLPGAVRDAFEAEPTHP
jgi:DNA-directed RNA polymerase specialized sigma24 family protein